MHDTAGSRSERVPTLTRRQVMQGLAAGAVVASAAGPVLAGQASASPTMRFGACGHPHTSNPYDASGSTVPGVSLATQVSMLQQMGVSMYRNDTPTDDAGHGKVVVHPRLLNLHSLLSAAGMEMFPMFYDNYSPSISEQDNYVRGFTKGEGLATNYGHMFTYCNLGNEWGLFHDLKNGPGHESGHWDMPKVDRATQWIKGANDGIKSVKPDAKTSVATTGWFPTWWQQHLLDNVDLDFIDWHWYADGQRNIGTLHDIGALPAEYDSVLDFLWDEYGLPIWVTESNERFDSDLSPEWNEQRQVNWFDFWYNECLSHPHCEGMFLYELLNEPVKGGQEAHFGLAKFPNFDPNNHDYTDWAWKRLGRQLTGLDQKIGHFGSDEGWMLGLGPEFPGAQGSFARDDSDAVNGTWSAVLSGDFTGGGNYVQTSRSIALDLSDLWFWVRTSDITFVTVRLTDTTGQVHQQRVPITPDDTWQAVHIWEFDAGQNYVHWGGANDGVWHGPGTTVALLLSRTALIGGQLTGQTRIGEVIATVP